MNSRFDYKPPKKRDSSKDDEFIEYEYAKKIRVVSTQKDGSVDKFTEESFFKEEKSSWSDFINSYDIGSVSDQVISHLTKGTPLVTAHTLPPADYTKLEKGAKIKKEMAEKGISIESLVQSVIKAIDEKSVESASEGEN